MTDAESAAVAESAESAEPREDYGRSAEELARLFGQETVELARRLDSADLNMSEEIVASIAAGVGALKKLRDNLAAQVRFVNGLEPGARLLLCAWILDMGLLDKLRTRSYLDHGE